MDIVKNVKEIGSEVEKNIEKGVSVVSSKVSEAFDNLASHLPFANLAKKEDSSFQVEVDLPGVKKEDIEIKVEDNLLVVTALRKYKKELTRDDYYICESSFGKFERRFALPESVDSEKIEAKYEDGTLTIALQKVPKAQAKSIAVH